MYLNSFNHFRAFSIVLIVAGHTYGLVGWNVDSLFERSIVNLITGGTFLFVFISGFLFHHVFYPKYEYKTFIQSKLRNVFVPYLILSMPPIIAQIMEHKDSWGGFFRPAGPGPQEAYLMPGLKFLWTGAAVTAYWYVPFILLTFLLSPLHVYFIRSRPRTQLLVIGLLTVVSIFMHRPLANLVVWQSVLYFAPVYLIGIFSSRNQEVIYMTLKGKEWLLLSATIAFAGLQAGLGVCGNYEKEAFHYGGVDVMFLQKVTMCFLLMVFLKRFDKVNNRFIHSVAATSFAVFFLHPFVIHFLRMTIAQDVANFSWISFPLFTLGIVGVCVIVAKAVQRMLPRSSRFLIGF